MISSRLEYMFNEAIRRANSLRHEFITIENIFLSLLQDKDIIGLLENFLGGEKAPLKEINEELNDFFKNDDHFSILSTGEIEELAQKQFANDELRSIAKENGILYQPEISMALQRSMQRAALHIQNSGKKRILPIHLLISCFEEKDSFSIYLLKKHGVTRAKLVELIAHGFDRPLTDLDDEDLDSADDARERGTKILENYTTNLTLLARDGKLDPMIGREDELRRTLQILMRRKKNNPLFVGEAGVGKTAIAHGIAQKLLEKNIPKELQGLEVYSLDMASLMAGTKFRGDFEERIKGIIKALENLDSPNGGLLFIDEIHTIVGAGATGGGSLDASNLLKPVLGEGGLKFMGSTTFDEYKKSFEKDAALNRRFQKVDILEPSLDETKKILFGLREKFETHHKVKYRDEIISQVVELTQKYLSGKNQPDKSIDLLDEVGSYARFLKDFEEGYEITHDDLETVIAKMARIPKKSVSAKEKEKLKNLERDLRLLIFGQDKAIEKVVDAVMLSRSGLRDGEKPVASFLFVGPTGVGKTELAKQLAFSLGVNFSRFDMSEYMEKHSVAKLIGAPPGYVGHGDGGQLTDEVSKNPYGVLLLDEIEKAHPDVLNTLLQVMDYGKLTDANGKTTDFRNIILIMTSNAGASELEQGGIGIANEKYSSISRQERTLKNFFTPEFRNRLDGIIPFVKLSDEMISSIVQKFLLQLENQILDLGFEFSYDRELVSFISKKSFDKNMGARPISRFIDSELKKKIAKMILMDEKKSGEKESKKIEVKIQEDDFSLYWA